MKTLQLKLILTILFALIFKQINAQELYQQNGSDRSWSYIIDNGLIPIGVNSIAGLTGSTINVNNNLVEGGVYAGRDIEQDIDIHSPGNSEIQRSDFHKWTRWYQEDGNTQIFRLFIDEYNVRNDRPGAPRIEAESDFEYNYDQDVWYEWSGRYTIIKAQDVNIFQIFADPEGDRGSTGVMMLGLRENGNMYWNKRSEDGTPTRTFAENMEGKSIDVMVRDDGHDYEVWINGELFETNETMRRVSNSHFRWGMYNHHGPMEDDAMIFVSHVQIRTIRKDQVDDENKPPVVSITNPILDSYEQGEDIPVTINANDPDGTIVKHDVFVNDNLLDTDGSHYSAPIIQNVQPGNYKVKIVVTDNDGATATATKSFTVSTNMNKPPTVSITNPILGSYEQGEDIPVTINANDPDGTIVKHDVFVNDNLLDTDGSHYSAPIIQNVQPGNYKIEVIVTDNDGATAVATKSFTVSKSNNQAPNVSFGSPSGNITVQEGYDLTVVVNANDPDGSISNVKLYINNSLVRRENVTPYEWGHDNSPNPNEVNGRSAGVYTVKAVATDNDGKTGQATFTLTIEGNDDGGDSGCSFDTPANSGLTAMDKVTYANAHVIGDNGPKIGNFRKFTINWVPSNNGLYQFAINTNNGSPDWYVDFKTTMTFQLKNSNPEVTLNNTGFEGLDGSYWVTQEANSFVMVSKTKDFAIYFSNSSSVPDCNRSNPVIDVSQIKTFPNPLSDSFLTISGMSSELKTLQIISVEGKVVKEFMTEKEIETVDVSELPSGSYFLSIKSIGFKESLLFVKK
ncbi:Ig-like domain-containing protein [Aquimarina sp. Aq107]|uniref:Ig-like domain-containing protein n=2 Tax=Aquimarina sp. Aq107 TaxID=1191912 RepID=UPI0020B2C975|nr:Ig-like domain-containing protein [Aquimarina sp. Aq107]